MAGPEEQKLELKKWWQESQNELVTLPPLSVTFFFTLPILQRAPYIILVASQQPSELALAERERETDRERESATTPRLLNDLHS